MRPLPPPVLSCYAEEAGCDLGRLALKSSVLAGLRIQDAFHFEPDPRLVPADSARLYQEFRQAWRECEALWRGLQDRLASLSGFWRLSAGRPRVRNLHDPLPLARLATLFLPRDPLARINFATVLLRRNRLEEAYTVLLEMLAWPGLRSEHLARAYRNLAAVSELLGRPDEVLEYASLAFVVAPWDPASRRDYLCYAIAVGDLPHVERASREIEDAAGADFRPREVLDFIRRRPTRAARRLDEDRRLARWFHDRLTATTCC